MACGASNGYTFRDCLAPTSDGFAAIARCHDRCSDRLSVEIDRKSKELYIQRNG